MVWGKSLKAEQRKRRSQTRGSNATKVWLNADDRNDANFCLHLVHPKGSPLKWLRNLSASGRGAQTLALGSHLLCETKKAEYALKFSNLD